MASSVSSYFITNCLPNGRQRTEDNNKDENEDGNETVKDKKKGKTNNKNRQMVLTRNELTRKRMDLIREKLEESRARYFEKVKTQALNCSRPIPRVSDVFSENRERYGSGNEKDVAPIVNDNDPSYVYYVVSPDKEKTVVKPKSKSERRKTQIQTPKESSRKSRSFTKKEDYGIFTEKTKSNMLAKSLGISSTSIEAPEKSFTTTQIAFPLPVRFTPKNPPATPATTITASTGFRGSRGDLDSCEFGPIYEKPIKMTICEDGGLINCLDSSSQELVRVNNSARSVSTRCLELPFISVDEQRKALGTAGSYGVKSLDFVRKSISQGSSQKKVHFAESVSVDMPSVKGSQFGGSYEVLPYVGERANTVPDMRSDKSKSLSEYKSLPEARRLQTSSARRQDSSLDLPKIDIVSSVYDELIVKAVQAYIMTLPTYSNQYKIARELVEQLQSKSITPADLGKEKYRSIREDIANIPRRKPMSKQRNRNEIKRAKQFSPVEPKCFRLILPGSTLKEPKISVLPS